MSSADIQPAAPEHEIDIKTVESNDVISKYDIPPKVYFLKEKRHVALSDLVDLEILRDAKDKMTLRGKARAADGQLYKTSTYLGLKDKPKKKRAPRKKKAPVSDAAQKAADELVAKVAAE